MTDLRITFYDMMRAAHVKRWHVINTARQENLAEHSWLVTVIALELASIMGHIGTIFSKGELTKFIGYAMFHDLPEVMLGDLPGNRAKDLYRKHGGPGLFTAMEAEVMPQIPYTGDIDPEYKIFIHMADKIQALWFISENGVGRQAKMAEAHCRRVLMDYLVQCETEDGKDWTTPVNNILMALSMPYISRESRTSPP